MKETRFYQQAELLLHILPFVGRNRIFALKGGTAINFFIRELPRLSVDIDLTYLPIDNREKALSNISNQLKQSSEQITSKMADVQLTFKYAAKSKTIVGMVISRKNVSVKIEPNLVLRGSVYEPSKKLLCKPAQEMFGISVSFLTLSTEDLYGGKICAALDRQHPRDLFDVKLLLENEGFNERIRKAFIVYLISHSRPIVELLNPNLIDFKSTFEYEFYGMTDHPVQLEDLLHTRDDLIRKINTDLSENERRFILSVKSGEPNWNLFGLDHIKSMPAVLWKLNNIKQMDPKKHKQSIDKLKKYLEL